VFEKSKHDSLKITHYIHEAGSCVVGIYTHQIAETKVDEVHYLAKQNSFPLKATFEEV
jgi:ATP-dependent Clp protease adaptor protein ClpS